MADTYNYNAQPPQYDQKGPPEVNYGGYAPPQGQMYPPPPMQGYATPGHVIQNQPASNSVVVMGQPGPAMQGVRPWNSGLFDCFNDISICLCGTFCSLCLVCQLASDMGEHMCVACCVPAPVTALRTKWRAQNRIEGSIMSDCLLEAFCGPCSACQLAREVKTAKLTGDLQKLQQ